MAEPKIGAVRVTADRLSTDLLVLHVFERDRAAVGFVAKVDALYDGKSEQFIETRVRFEDGRVGSVSATITLLDAATYPAAAASPALSKQAA